MSHYFPFANGKYEVKPGLTRLGTDFGNGEMDELIFQVDECYPRFRENKVACRQENIRKYFQRQQEQPATLQAVNLFLLQQLVESYPPYFTLEVKQDVFRFINHLSATSFYFETQQHLIGDHDYLSLFDALASQVPEDLAIWQVDGEQDYLSAIHLCAPNHWAPAEKIGKPFAAVHSPVAGMEALRARYKPMLHTLLKGGTYVRFAWGLGTDIRLNHHPEPPPAVKPAEWNGRHFNPDDPELYVRVERQTLTGFPGLQAVLFTIRTYFEDVGQLERDQLLALKNAIMTMPEGSLRYKGLHGYSRQITLWIEELIQHAIV